MNRIKIYKLNGDEINLDSYGLFGLSLIISAPSYSVVKESVDGRAGAINLGKTLQSRQLTVSFKVDANDYSDSLLLRDELFALFNGEEKFYISEAKQPGKRWLVESVSPWTPERYNARTSVVSLDLICDEGLAESVATTLTAKEWDVDMYQWGMGIDWEDYNYTHNVSNFVIYNASNVVIDPRFMDLVITIKATASGYIELINQTTGETYRYDGTLTTSDTLKIDGIRSTKNDLSVFRDTNKKLITLNPGENQFLVNGTSAIESISFEFRFKYL